MEWSCQLIFKYLRSTLVETPKHYEYDYLTKTEIGTEDLPNSEGTLTTMQQYLRVSQFLWRFPLDILSRVGWYAWRE
jgi:hypothetical protein